MIRKVYSTTTNGIKTYQEDYAVIYIYIYTHTNEIDESTMLQ